MTDPHDVENELLARLSDADPIDTTDLPTPSSPRARALLEDIMTSETPTSDPAHVPTEGEGDEAPLLDLPSVEGIDRYASPRRQRLGVIAAIAAAFVAIVGFLVVSPGGTEPALASVHSAARATAEADSGRATTTFVLEATDGTNSESVAGEMQTEFSGTDVAATVDLDELGDEAGDLLPAGVEMRFVDGVVYGRDGDVWYAVETGGTFGQAAIERIDPRNVLETVQSLVATTEVGAAEIGGVATTHYQSVIDLADESLRDSGWLPVDPAEIEAAGAMTIDLFVDDEGLLRQLVVSGDVVATDGSGGSGTVLITSSFFDFGADITIEAPATAEFIDPGNELELEELTPTD